MNTLPRSERKARSSVPLPNVSVASAASHEARGAEAERERVRDALHNGIGQLLTSISFLASSLQQKLAEQKLPEANEAAEILALTCQAIDETQMLVREGPPPARPTGRLANVSVGSNPLT